MVFICNAIFLDCIIGWNILYIFVLLVIYNYEIKKEDVL